MYAAVKQESERETIMRPTPQGSGHILLRLATHIPEGESYEYDDDLQVNTTVVRGERVPAVLHHPELAKTIFKSDASGED